MVSHIIILKDCAADYEDSVISYFAVPAINCGFPSPAYDELEVRLSITDFITSNPSTTFFGRAMGTSLEGIGINENDILVIDRSQKPNNDDIIIFGYEGGFTAKKVLKEGGKLYLISENPSHPPILISDPDNLVVWGIVVKIIKDIRTVSPLRKYHDFKKLS